MQQGQLCRKGEEKRRNETFFGHNILQLAAGASPLSSINEESLSAFSQRNVVSGLESLAAAAQASGDILDSSFRPLESGGRPAAAVTASPHPVSFPSAPWPPLGSPAELEPQQPAWYTQQLLLQQQQQPQQQLGPLADHWALSLQQLEGHRGYPQYGTQPGFAYQPRLPSPMMSPYDPWSAVATGGMAQQLMMQAWHVQAMQHAQAHAQALQFQAMQAHLQQHPEQQAHLLQAILRQQLPEVNSGFGPVRPQQSAADRAAPFADLAVPGLPGLHRSASDRDFQFGPPESPRALRPLSRADTDEDASPGPTTSEQLKSELMQRLSTATTTVLDPPREFILLQQPSAKQRKCYAPENRYLLPHPLTICPNKRFFDPPHPYILSGMVSVRLVFADNGEAPESRGCVLVSADGKLSRMLDISLSASFSLKVVGSPEGHVFQLEFVVVYTTLGHESTPFEERVVSRAFSIYSNRRGTKERPLLDRLKPMVALCNEEAEVWIKGKGFAEKVSVLFDSRAAKIVERLDNLIIVKSPARPDLMAETTVEVQVMNSRKDDTQMGATGKLMFTYVPLSSTIDARQMTPIALQRQLLTAPRTPSESNDAASAFASVDVERSRASAAVALPVPVLPPVGALAAVTPPFSLEETSAALLAHEASDPDTVIIVGNAFGPA
eukprot:TRINITY_DN4997_c0_g1_i2.p1 TRINITY_DN4997_c0_g1~~TRINITY_DN4997_c0_g1_i2.p1  ORF type:complete len:666 (-),score=185.27 TRINITY_DN4997_c0_g1_i2:315-2312(-)